MGSFAFGFISSALVNPDSVIPNTDGIYPPEIANNVPYMIQMLSLQWAILSIVAFFMTYKPPVYESGDSFLANKNIQSIDSAGFASSMSSSSSGDTIVESRTIAIKKFDADKDEDVQFETNIIIME